MKMGKLDSEPIFELKVGSAEGPHRIEAAFSAGETKALTD
jgi:hypothetical protein